MPKKKANPNPMANQFTEWIGTPSSIIVHTLLFAGIFVLSAFGVSIEEILIILTTAVSLEAIYLSIFIQMSINRTSASLEEVGKDVDELQEDIEDIEGNVEDISKDIDEIQEDVEDIEGNVKVISKDIDEIQTDDDKQEDEVKRAARIIGKMESQMQEIMKELQTLKKKNGYQNGPTSTSPEKQSA